MVNLNKNDLIAQLENVKNNYFMGLAAISLMSESFAIKHLKQSTCNFGSYSISFHPLASLLAVELDKRIAMKEFTTMLIRGLLKESYEIVKFYVETNAQADKFKSQDWFHFYRLIRNAVSHNFHFDFGKFDKTLLPISWNGRIIDITLNEKPLEIAFLGYDGIWELFSDLKKFADHRLD